MFGCCSIDVFVQVGREQPSSPSRSFPCCSREDHSSSSFIHCFAWNSTRAKEFSLLPTNTGLPHWFDRLSVETIREREECFSNSSTPSPSIFALHVSWKRKERCQIDGSAPISKRSVESHPFVWFISSDHRRVNRWKSNEPFICSQSQCLWPSDGSQKNNFQPVVDFPWIYPPPIRALPSVSLILDSSSQSTSTNCGIWKFYFPKVKLIVPFSRAIRWRSSIESCNVRFHLFTETFGVLNGYLQLAQPISVRRLSLLEILQWSPSWSCRLTYVKYLRMLSAFELGHWFSAQWIWMLLRGVALNSLSNRKEDERVTFVFILLMRRNYRASLTRVSLHSVLSRKNEQLYRTSLEEKWKKHASISSNDRLLDNVARFYVCAEQHQYDHDEAEKSSLDRSGGGEWDRPSDGSSTRSMTNALPAAWELSSQGSWHQSHSISRTGFRTVADTDDNEKDQTEMDLESLILINIRRVTIRHCDRQL